MSALHPMQRLVLASFDDGDQDTIERLCRGRWQDVSLIPHGEDQFIAIRGRRTVFALEPDESEFFADEDAGADPAPPVDHSKAGPCGDPACHVLHEDPENPIHPPDYVDSRAAPRQPDPEPVAPERLPNSCAECGAPCRRKFCSDVHRAAFNRRRYQAEEADRLAKAGRTADKGDQAAAAAATAGQQAAAQLAEPPHSEEEQPTTPVVDLDGSDVPVTTAAAEVVEAVAEVAEDAAALLRAAVEADQAPLPDPPPTRPCGRCEQVGHFTEDCPYPSARKAREALAQAKAAEPAPDPFVASQEKAKAQTSKRQEKDAGEGPRVIVCGRCKQEGHSVFTCKQSVSSRPVVVRALEGDVTDDDLTAHSNFLRELCKDGLPDRFQYSYLPDVLALYGVDFDLLDAAVRHPERVELRPESYEKDKRYCVLAFHRGDLQIIMGMRQPATPKVIAAYATSRLAHDVHRVGHTGGGGSRKTSGLPGTPKQVGTRLRDAGCRVEIDEREKTAEVTYKGQSLGRVNCQTTDRKVCEADYQRMIRKVHAIDQRATA